MKKCAIAGCLAALFAGAAVLQAQDFPEMPKPTKEHKWLRKFVGEWEQTAEIYMEPGKPPMASKGTDRGRMMGGFWLVSNGKAEMEGMPPFRSVLTLGYDPEKKKYVGTWIDTMSSHLWQHEGTVDESGKILTMETEGPCPKAPGTTVKFKEVTEFKSDDHRVFTSSMQDENGKWQTVVKVESKRVSKAPAAKAAAKQ